MERFTKRIDKDVFNGKETFVETIKFTPTLGLAKEYPICSFVTGAFEKIFLDESLAPFKKAKK